jgi:ESCRT-II complex subunit VPS22
MGAIAREREDAARRAELGERAAAARAADAAASMARFKAGLEAFAAAHRDEIRRDPVFRRDFVALARSIGVDPLASSKTVWSGFGVGDFYFALAVRAAGVCVAARAANGGLMPLAELTRTLARAGNAKAGAPATEDDVAAALAKLAVLGDGFAEVRIGGVRYVRSVADALSTDSADVLGAAAAAAARARGGAPPPPARALAAAPSVTVASAAAELGWDRRRAAAAIDALLRDGLAWVDAQAAGGAAFYFPALLGGA